MVHINEEPTTVPRVQARVSYLPLQKYRADGETLENCVLGPVVISNTAAGRSMRQLFSQSTDEGLDFMSPRVQHRVAVVDTVAGLQTP